MRDHKLVIAGGAAVVAVAAVTTLVLSLSGGPAPVAEPLPDPLPASPSATPLPSPSPSVPVATSSEATVTTVSPAAPRRGGTFATTGGAPRRTGKAPAKAKAPAGPRPSGPPAAGGELEPEPWEGAFAREDPLPDGVPQQVSFFFGGGPVCGSDSGNRPRNIGLGSDAVIPTEFILCFSGFRHDLPLKITLTPPGGKGITRMLTDGSEDEGFWYRWPRLPSDPAGGYRVTARQQGRDYTETIKVSAPRGPRLWVDEPPAGIVLGDDVHMYVAGFPPSRTAMLNLYRFHEYRTSFPIKVDARGGGHAVLRTSPADPLSCWGVSHPALGDSTEILGPGQTSFNVFCPRSRE